MSDAILVRGIRTEGKHGLAATGERDKAQPFVVDAEVRRDFHGIADDLGATINYVEIAKAVRGVVETESFELLESLANAIAARLLALGADSVRVRVAKPRSADLVGAAEIAVVVERASG